MVATMFSAFFPLNLTPVSSAGAGEKHSTFLTTGCAAVGSVHALRYVSSLTETTSGSVGCTSIPLITLAWAQISTASAFFSME